MTRQEAIALVRKEQAALRAILFEDPRERNWSEWRRRSDEANTAAIKRLTEAGAVIRDDWRGTVFKLDGIRCTCTSGISGALGNWLRRAERKARK